MRLRRSLAAALRSGCLILLSAAGSRGQAVDTRPAIEIGPYHVSHYIVGKYYGRYAAGLSQSRHRAVTPAEAQAWLDQYIAKQEIIADLLARGLFDHPAVRHAVDLMEQHMLTQTEGPLYAQLLADHPAPSEAVLRRRYIDGSRPTDCLVVAFADQGTRDQLIGADFLPASRTEQLRRLHAAETRPGVRYFEGTVRWPFDPFPEIGDTLLAAEENVWTPFNDPDFGAYLILKRHVGPPGRENFERDRAAFARHVAYVDKQIFVHRRHAALLRAAKFQLDETTVGKLAAVLARLDPANELIPPAAVPAGTLYHFEPAGRPVDVTTLNWVTRWNGQFIRHVPRSVAEVQTAAEDDAAWHLDLRAARALGIDRTPQFVEDRKGYAALQALDYYEQHELAPAIAIPDAELHAYYDAHRDTFAQTLRVSGRLIAFPDEEKALAWLRARGPSGPEGAENIALARPQVPPGFEAFEGAIFEAPPGFPVGPVSRDGRFYCFQKSADLERGTAPFEQVRETVRRALLRGALDQREQQLAAQLALAHPAKINVTAAELAGDGIRTP